MAFEFSLATVLRVRESIEEREERALQKIQMEIGLALHQLEELTAAIAGAHAAREQAMRQPMAAVHMQSMLENTASAEASRMTLLQQLEVLEQARAEQMRRYHAAHRDRETLTEMLNQQREAYELEQVRMEQKQLDDIFVARRHRGK